MEMSDVSLTAGPALSQPSDTRIGSQGAENRDQEHAQGSGVLWAEQEMPVPGWRGCEATQGWTLGAQAEGSPGHKRSGGAHTWHSWAPCNNSTEQRTETKGTEM